MILKTRIPKKAGFLFTSKKFFKVMPGGRVGGKSISAAQYVLIKAYESPKRVICARELQNSISASVLSLLKEWIENLGLQAFYTVTNNQIVGLNGSLFTFEGLRTNVESLKSIPSIDIVWVEEAAKVSQHSWDVLIPTVTRTHGSEIVVTFNPELEEDPTSQMFLVEGSKQFRSDADVVRMNWSDNPWFDEKSREEKDRMYARDTDRANNIWGGQYLKHSEAAIFGDKCVIESFDLDGVVGASAPLFGADWGFSKDPTVLVRSRVYKDDLYIEYEAGAVGVSTRDIPALFTQVPGWWRFKADPRTGKPTTTKIPLPNVVIVGDCANLNVVNDLQNMQVPVVACKKWPNSVEDGIAALRCFKRIVIHPRCERAIHESKMYRWKVDKQTDKVLNVPVDADNHIWDAVRYSLQEWIMQTEQQMIYSVDSPEVKISPELDDFEQRNFQAPAFEVW